MIFTEESLKLNAQNLNKINHRTKPNKNTPVRTDRKIRNPMPLKEEHVGDYSERNK